VKLLKKKANLAVLGTNVAQKSAKLAMEGEYTDARMKAFSNKLLLKRITAEDDKDNKELYSKFKNNIVHLDHKLASAKRKEKESGLALSDDEGEMENDEPQRESSRTRSRSRSPVRTSDKKEKNRSPSPKKKSKKEKEKQRKISRNDSTAKVLYQMRKTSSDVYKMK